MLGMPTLPSAASRLVSMNFAAFVSKPEVGSPLLKKAYHVLGDL